MKAFETFAHLLHGGLKKQGGFQQITFDPESQAFIELGIDRMEKGVGRKFTHDEKTIYYGAFISALTVAGEVFKK